MSTSPRVPAVLAMALVVLTAPGALAQRMPPPSVIEDWKSTHNINRLRADQQVLPEYRSKTLPDGTVKPPKAPWPFLLYVVEQDSKSSKKIKSRLLQDTRVILSTHAVKLVQTTPERALDLPYLGGVSLRDPSLIFLDRDFQVIAAFTDEKKFEERAVMPMLAKLSDAEYPVKLSRFLGGLVDVMEEEEKLWKTEERASEIQDRAARSRPDRQKQLDEEAAAMEEEVENQRDVLAVRFLETLGQLQPRVEKRAPTPTTFGSGKKARELTPEEKEAIDAYREFALHDNPIVRAAATEDLGSIDSGAMVQFILKAAKDSDPRVVAAAGRALGRMKSDEALETMMTGVTTGDPRSRRAAILGFAEVRRRWPAVVPVLIPLLSASDDDIRHAVLRALARQQHDSATVAIVGALDDRVPALRVMAANALGEMQAKPATPALCSKLTDSDWSLKKAVCVALGKIRARDSIEPLLLRFEAEDGLMLEAIYDALVRITGEDFSIRPEFWRRWWDRYGDRFELPTDAEIEKILAARAKAMEKYNGPNINTFHTIATTSRRMLFVIDVSSSMAGKIPIPPGTSDEDAAKFPSRVKMDIARDELLELLAALESNVRFNIITFAGKVRRWKSGLVGMGSRTAAIKFVAKLQPLKPTTSRRRGAGGGGDEQKTNTYGALMEAFGLAGTASDWKKRSDADTVFLVTDGDPTTGDIVDVDALCEHFTDLNRTRGMVIHLVTFDDQTARRLGPIATRNGGQVVVRGF